MNRKVKQHKSKGFGTKNNLEVTYTLTRQEARKMLLDFLLEPEEESRSSIEVILDEGFKGLEKMNNEELARELESWHLIRDPETENYNIIIS